MESSWGLWVFFISMAFLVAAIFIGWWGRWSPKYRKGGRSFGDYHGPGSMDWPEYPSGKGYGYGDHTGAFGPYVGRGPRDYQRSDTKIAEDINDRLTAHGEIDATDIQVTVLNGEVNLTGSVENRATKRLVEEVVDSVSGIKDVKNELHITRSRPESPMHRTEERPYKKAQ